MIKDKKKHWIKTPAEFTAGGYDWAKINVVSLGALDGCTSDDVANILLRAKGDKKVYIVENGKKRWIKTADEFNAAGYDWQSIQDTTSAALTAYPDSEQVAALVKIINALTLRLRGADSTNSAVLGAVKKNETYTVLEKKNGWYKIKAKNGKEGWISGKYASEDDED